MKKKLLLILPLFLVGAIDGIRAYRKGDLQEVVAVCLIFFVLAPLLAIWSARLFKS